MTWYLSGPMSGIEDSNYPEFERVMTLLRERGMTIVSPHEDVPVSPEHSWADYLKRDLLKLVSCDGIILMHGWSKSRGARLELGVALELSMRVMYLVEDTDDLLECY